ncbi:hypothetical protein Ga0076813_16062, partial [endosymbiont of Ridgeia piscesae]
MKVTSQYGYWFPPLG